MKELSIEEKAKAYDKAIKVAADIKAGIATYITDGTPVIDAIFPELKESEGERIRKAILELVRQSSEILEKKNQEQMIAWLEKQGEKELVTCPICGWELEKISKQKPTNKVEPKKEDTSELTPFEAELFSMMSDAWQGYQLGEEVNIAEIVKEHSSELLERANKQKPAEWSEEDETTKNNISHIIRQYDKISKKENQPCWYVGDCLLWMQNIKDRVQPKPKQEWSEEDEEMLNEIVKDLQVYKSREISRDAKDAYQNEIDWLKSLRPQNTWKPSIAQLNALSIVSKGNAPDDIEAIVSLYNDLKKLREE